MSQSLPMINLAMMVDDTEAMMIFPTCDFVKPRSSRMVGISGANPNQPKKQTKNVNHVMWKLRICTDLMLNILSFSKGLLLTVGCILNSLKCVKNTWKQSYDGRQSETRSNYLRMKSGLILIIRYAQFALLLALATFFTVSETSEEVLQ